jgi:hypothetical protein
MKASRRTGRSVSMIREWARALGVPIPSRLGAWRAEGRVAGAPGRGPRGRPYPGRPGNTWRGAATTRSRPREARPVTRGTYPAPGVLLDGMSRASHPPHVIVRGQSAGRYEAHQHGSVQINRPKSHENSKKGGVSRPEVPIPGMRRVRSTCCPFCDPVVETRPPCALRQTR